jgi:hypothetical protein
MSMLIVSMGMNDGKKHGLVFLIQKKRCSPLARRCVAVVADAREAGEREEAYEDVWGSWLRGRESIGFCSWEDKPG